MSKLKTEGRKRDFREYIDIRMLGTISPIDLTY